MYILETHARTEKEAIDLSADYLETDPENLEVRLFKKGGGGFLGIGSKDPSIFHVYPIKGKTPREIVIKGVISTILHKMGFSCEVNRIEKTEEGKTYVEIISDSAGNIIGKRGKTLESLQFLTNIIVEKFTEEQPKILLDIENYRARRAKYLSSLARKVADGAIRSGRKRSLDPLNPYERRLVHMELQEDNRVSTESEGSGVYKKVWIIPVKKASPARESVDVIEETILIAEEETPVMPDDAMPPEMFEEETDKAPAEDPPQPMTSEADYN